jgi:polysaccharide export outer membrane protein
MFQVPEGYPLSKEIDQAHRNYLIQKNDLLQLEVYTNSGERILQPNTETTEASVSVAQVEGPSYLITQDGSVKFPLIDKIKLDGFSIRQAEEMLQQEYTKFYQQPFVKLSYSNKRVTVLGALGGQVIPLANENMKLAEVLALAKGLPNDSKASNIRILRDSSIYLADLSTIDGYLKNNMIVQPNDIIYVEPIRRPFSEALRDYGPVFAIIASLSTLIVVIVGLN